MPENLLSKDAVDIEVSFQYIFQLPKTILRNKLIAMQLYKLILVHIKKVFLEVFFFVSYYFFLLKNQVKFKKF